MGISNESDIDSWNAYYLFGLVTVPVMWDFHTGSR